MAEVIAICEKNYLEECKEEEGANYNEKVERDFYYEDILQSCSLVGELKN